MAVIIEGLTQYEIEVIAWPLHEIAMTNIVRYALQ